MRDRSRAAQELRVEADAMAARARRMAIALGMTETCFDCGELLTEDGCEACELVARMTVSLAQSLAETAHERRNAGVACQECNGNGYELAFRPGGYEACRVCEGTGLLRDDDGDRDTQPMIAVSR